MNLKKRMFGIFVFLAVIYSGLELIWLVKIRNALPQKPSDKNRPSVLLVIGVMSKLTKYDRRNAIRMTWFKTCLSSSPGQVVCRFATDSPENHTILKNITKENNVNKDMLFMPYRDGINFGLRFVWLMKWFSERFDFQYFLRIDDDYFLCLEKLLAELIHRPKHGLYWGWLHCGANQVRVDEGWMILTKDIIDEALDKLNQNLMCHPYAGLQLPLWIMNSRLNVTYFADNKRIAHLVPNQNRYYTKNVCLQYLAIHRAYPVHMVRYWELYRASISKNYSIDRIRSVENICKFNVKDFNLKSFRALRDIDPKPCNGNPVWRLTFQSQKGRE